MGPVTSFWQDWVASSSHCPQFGHFSPRISHLRLRSVLILACAGHLDKVRNTQRAPLPSLWLFELQTRPFALPIVARTVFLAQFMNSGDAHLPALALFWRFQLELQ